MLSAGDRLYSVPCRPGRHTSARANLATPPSASFRIFPSPSEINLFSSFLPSFLPDGSGPITHLFLYHFWGTEIDHFSIISLLCLMAVSWPLLSLTIHLWWFRSWIGLIVLDLWRSKASVGCSDVYIDCQSFFSVPPWRQSTTGSNRCGHFVFRQERGKQNENLSFLSFSLLFSLMRNKLRQQKRNGEKN